MEMKIKASYHQERLWFIDRFEAGDLYDSGPIYHNIPFILEIEGPLDIGILEQSLQAVANRHEALRTRIVTIDNTPFQSIELVLDIKLIIIDAAEKAGEDWGKCVLELGLEEAKRPFLLDRDPLIRAVLIQINGQRNMLVIALHHIISDRFSLGILAREMVQLYDAHLNRELPTLPELSIHYADFSLFQQELPEEVVESLLFYWRRQLREQLRPLNLPTDRPRSLVHKFREGRETFKITTSLSEKIRSFSRQHEVSHFILLLGAFEVLIHRYTGQDEIVIGTSVDNRRQPGTENVIGPLANLLVLRNHFLVDSPFMEVCSNLRKVVDKAYENQDLPFDKLVSELNPDKDMSRTALFDVLFQYEETPLKVSSATGLKIMVVETNLGWGKYDLNLLIQGGGDAFSGILVYNKDYYERSTLSRFIGHYINILEGIVQDPEQPISSLTLLTEKEKQQLLGEWHRIQVQYPADKTIHQLFGEQVEKEPDKTALIDKGDSRWDTASLTYNELSRRADQLSGLLHKKGVKPDTIVAIMVGRSLEMIVGILGILKAGGAYLPIDPGYPKARIDYMLGDSGAHLFLTTRSLVGKGEEVRKLKSETVILEDLWRDSHSFTPPLFPHLGPSGLAYVIYTSGTTGKPKGALIEHRNVVRLMFNDEFQFDFGSADIWTMFHSYCFDFSVWEICGALLYGGKLVLISVETAREPAKFLDILMEQKVTVLNQTPSAFYSLMNAEQESQPGKLAVRYVIFGGEALNPLRLKEWRKKHPGIKLINMFGITETTVHVTYKEIGDYEVQSNVSNIGMAIPTLKTFMMDNNLNLLPIGVPGELFVGGEGLGRGYLNRVKLTAEKFVEDPLQSGERLYRSGDLARLLSNREMEYLGRIDQQVKIRGYRIELAEIESQLLKHEAVKEVVVTARGEEKLLYAYFVPVAKFPADSPDRRSHDPDESVDAGEFRAFLGKQLPDYMIPSYFVQIDRVPLTANGKIDLKVLPTLEAGGVKREYAAPRSNIEKKLVEIWTDILRIKKESIGIDTSFFELGGHSLRAALLTSRIRKEFAVEVPLRVVFTSPAIRSLAGYISGAQKSVYEDIRPVERREFYPQSSTQRRLFFLDQFESIGTSYNMPSLFKVNGKIDKGLFEKSVAALISRHECLRTSFELIDSQMAQRVHEAAAVEFNVEYFTYAAEDHHLSLHIQHLLRPFDLSKIPLLRVGLAEISAEEFLLLFDMHHIICDGTSTGILVDDFIRLYDGEKLPPLKIQYKDFTLWQKNLVETGKIKEQEDYWLNIYPDPLSIPCLDLPTDNEQGRPAVFNFKGAYHPFYLGEKETSRLKQVGSQDGLNATLFMSLLAAFNILLRKYTGQDDIVVGCGIMGRPHADLQSIIGMFVNSLPMRNHLSSDKIFLEFLKEVKKNAVDAFENQDIQFEDLVEKVHPRRDPSRNPIFDVAFVFQNFERAKKGMKDTQFSSYELENRTSKFDLTLFAHEVGDGIYFMVEYCTSLFKRETIQRLAVHLLNTIRQVGNTPELPIADIQMLTEAERLQLLVDFNQSGGPCSMTKTIHQLFEEQSEKTPDNMAVVSQEARLTYRELGQRADRLAGLLREKGAAADTLICLMAERSAAMVAGILGILKSGGAYLPIDPAYPPERVRYMLDDSGSKILVNESVKLAKVSEKVEVIELKKVIRENKDFSTQPIRSPQPGPSNLAYVLYTSGSTGEPKGVMVEHRSVTNLLVGLQQLYPFEVNDTYLFKTSYMFDVSVTEIFGWFLGGGRLAILEKAGEKNPEKIVQAIIEYRVTHMNFVPSMFNGFLEALSGRDIHYLSPLKYIFLAGEALLPGLVDKFNRLNSGACLENLYGPTEATVYASGYSLSQWAGRGSIPIGKPLQNTRLYILDRAGNVQPIGVWGELYVGGDGVARGYLKRGELSSERFIPSPFTAGERLYRTGDLARWCPDGLVEYRGRIDHQVKIRGYRVELGEIESRLLKHEKVNEAVVTVKTDESGGQYLCAYVVPVNGGAAGKAEDLNMSELREYLGKMLPDYMIPYHYKQLEKIPFTANGKVDRKVLLAMDTAKVGTGTTYVPLRNEVEMQIADVWKEVLKHDRIGRNDNFFDLGGNSLNIIHVANKLKRDFGMEIPVVSIFEYPTIGTLFQYLSREGDIGRPPGPASVGQEKIDRSDALEAAKRSRKRQQAKRNPGINREI